MVEDTISFFTCKFLLSNVIVIGIKSDIQVEHKERVVQLLGERSFNTGDCKNAGL